MTASVQEQTQEKVSIHGPLSHALCPCQEGKDPIITLCGQPLFRKERVSDGARKCVVCLGLMRVTCKLCGGTGK